MNLVSHGNNIVSAQSLDSTEKPGRNSLEIGNLTIIVKTPNSY